MVIVADAVDNSTHFANLLTIWRRFVDRRIQKTRKSIMSAFFDLLAENGFEKVTINDIAARANINRGTIYLHYMDKFDLLDKCIEAYVEQLKNHCSDSAGTNLNPVAFRFIFEYLEENFAIYSLLLCNEGAQLFRSRLYIVLAETLTEVVGTANNAFSNSTTIHFVTSGFIGVLEWWISNAMPVGVPEITGQLMVLLEPYTKHLI